MKNSALVIKRFWQEEDGVTAIEYGLIAGLIAIVIIVALQNVGNNLGSIFNYIAGQLSSA